MRAWMAPATKASVAALICLLLSFQASAEPRNPDQVRAELERVRAELSALQTQQADQLRQRDASQSALAESERDLNQIRQRRLAVEQQLATAEAALVQLMLQSQADQAVLRQRLHQFSLHLSLLHRQGGTHPLRPWLAMDSPQHLARQLAYHRHLVNHRQQQISALTEAVARVYDNAAQQRARRDELAGLAENQNVLEAQQRAAVALRAQRLAEAEAAIGSTQARLAQAQADAEALSDLLQRLATVTATLPPLGDDLARITQLRGQLIRPVLGRVLEGFGQSRGAELRRTGWLMAAPVGTEVRASAHGRVAFADWLRGYGLLIILDHGEGVMSLYGQNQTILREVGDWVPAGEVIAITGADERGLYFELRENGRPVNPQNWLQPPAG